MNKEQPTKLASVGLTPSQQDRVYYSHYTGSVRAVMALIPTIVWVTKTVR